MYLVLAPVAAQEQEAEARWVQRHYGSTDGLPVSSGSTARIDADGFLWLATHDGLARFDGQHFDVHESMRFPALSGNRVQSLHLDAQQRLYALTAHGDWVSVRSGSIERVALGGEGPQYVRHVDDASLCVTTAQALHCPDGAGGFPLLARFPPHVEPAQAVSDGAGRVWMMSTIGEVWLQRHAGWRRMWQPEVVSRPRVDGINIVGAGDAAWVSVDGRLLRVSVTGAARRWLGEDDPMNVSTLRRGPDGDLWIAALNGVFRIAQDGRPYRVFATGEPVRGTQLHNYRNWHAPDGALWVSRGGRLWRLVGEAGAAAPRPVLESGEAIQDVIFGEDGVVWAMTLRDGVYRLSRARVDLLDADAGFGRGNVYGVSRGRDGTMWLGSLDGGLISVERSGNIRFHGRADGLPGDSPWVVVAADDGSIYVGTYAPGLWRRAPGGERFEPVPLPDELLGEAVFSIPFDRAGDLWLGTSAGAWRRRGLDWQRQWPLTPRRLRVAALALSQTGEVWFGGAEGVWRQHDGHAHAVAEALLSRTSVRDLYRSADGALWISTDGRGLVRVAADDPRGERAVQLGRAQGLPSNSPHTVRDDARGHVWVNSNQGIFRINRPELDAFLAGQVQRLSPLVLGLSDGLTELEGNGGVQPAAAFDPDGRLWFPSQRGVVRFDPLRIPLRTHPPKARIDGVESGGMDVLPDDSTTLPVGVRNVLIRYGAADLGTGSQVRFRYRLLPQDRDWTDAASERSASFSTLRPGRNRFELLAGNSDGVWSDTPAVLEFDVPHRWHERDVVRWGAAMPNGVLRDPAPRDDDGAAELGTACIGQGSARLPRWPAPLRRVRPGAVSADSADACRRGAGLRVGVFRWRGRGAGPA